MATKNGAKEGVKKGAASPAEVKRAASDKKTKQAIKKEAATQQAQAQHAAPLMAAKEEAAVKIRPDLGSDGAPSPWASWRPQATHAQPPGRLDPPPSPSGSLEPLPPREGPTAPRPPVVLRAPRD